MVEKIELNLKLHSYINNTKTLLFADMKILQIMPNKIEIFKLSEEPLIELEIQYDYKLEVKM